MDPNPSLHRHRMLESKNLNGVTKRPQSQESRGRPAYPVSPNRGEVRQKVLRWGCRLCPGVHFKVRPPGCASPRGSSLLKHIKDKHPQIKNSPGGWESVQYRWGRRVYYKSGVHHDEPFDAGSDEDSELVSETRTDTSAVGTPEVEDKIPPQSHEAHPDQNPGVKTTKDYHQHCNLQDRSIDAIVEGTRDAPSGPLEVPALATESPFLPRATGGTEKVDDSTLSILRSQYATNSRVKALIDAVNLRGQVGLEWAQLSAHVLRLKALAAHSSISLSAQGAPRTSPSLDTEERNRLIKSYEQRWASQDDDLPAQVNASAELRTTDRRPGQNVQPTTLQATTDDNTMAATQPSPPAQPSFMFLDAASQPSPWPAALLGPGSSPHRADTEHVQQDETIPQYQMNETDSQEVDSNNCKKVWPATDPFAVRRLHRARDNARWISPISPGDSSWSSNLRDDHLDDFVLLQMEYEILGMRARFGI